MPMRYGEQVLAGRGGMARAAKEQDRERRGANRSAIRPQDTEGLAGVANY
jgi:hypothetical protein